QIGTTVTFTYTSPAAPAPPACSGWSLGTSPGIDLGSLRVVLPLNNDFLMEAAISGNPIFGPSWQTPSAAARRRRSLAIPNAPQFVSIDVRRQHHAGTDRPRIAGSRRGVRRWR
ncbi:MAG: hypothetical protein IPK26_00005, partial [Planctomycetes bacterium]|nr:hypothetical protein [Planctomycetota bacterium]